MIAGQFARMTLTLGAFGANRFTGSGDAQRQAPSRAVGGAGRLRYSCMSVNPVLPAALEFGRPKLRPSESTERALEACQDAVLAPELWPAALQSLSDSFGASSTVLLPVDSPTTRAPISAEHFEFDALWHRNQSHAPCIFTRKAPCKLGLPYVIEQQIVSPEEREQDPYFHETARVGDRDWWAEVCFPVADKQWCLALYRSAELGPFTHEDGRYSALAGSRLSRILGSAERFAQRQASSTLSALEQLNSAALVID
jgi:hypothetical protein